MAVMGGCGTNRAVHGTGHGTIDLSAVAAQKAPTPVKGGTKLASVSGKVGGADRLPGASATKTIAKGAPSDAEVRRELKKYEKAVSDYERTVALKPDLPYARGNLLLARLQCCDWRGFAQQRAEIAAALRTGRSVPRCPGRRARRRACTCRS